MSLIIVISTGDFQIRWNVLSLLFSERDGGILQFELYKRTMKQFRLLSYTNKLITINSLSELLVILALI